jgi:hypothetical protein
MTKEPAEWDDLDEGRQERLKAALQAAEEAGNSDLVKALQAAIEGREPSAQSMPDSKAMLERKLLEDLLLPDNRREPGS